MKTKLNGIEIQKATLAYLATALWSSTVTLPRPEGDLVDGCMDIPDGEPLSGVPDGEPLDDWFTTDDCMNKMIHEAEADCNDFFGYIDNLGLYEKAIEYADDEQIAHDFWLTRNGHGAGFWDGDYGDIGRELTKAAKTFGESHILVTYPGLLCFI